MKKSFLKEKLSENPALGVTGDVGVIRVLPLSFFSLWLSNGFLAFVSGLLGARSKGVGPFHWGVISIALEMPLAILRSLLFFYALPLM